jgi:2-amino-4-hydroxy-6-hydroxymethyldihydropteridine diphosphokinase
VPSDRPSARTPSMGDSSAPDLPPVAAPAHPASPSPSAPNSAPASPSLSAPSSPSAPAALASFASLGLPAPTRSVPSSFVPPGPVHAYIALGSNLGPRDANLRFALEAMAATPGLRVLRVSSFHETAPVGGPPGQGPYLNAAALLETTLSPRQLLERLLATELLAGRTRSIPNAPRTLDLDLLLYADLAISEPDLHVPHPRMWGRSFVVGPLGEIRR